MSLKSKKAFLVSQPFNRLRLRCHPERSQAIRWRMADGVEGPLGAERLSDDAYGAFSNRVSKRCGLAGRGPSTSVPCSQRERGTCAQDDSLAGLLRFPARCL